MAARVAPVAEPATTFAELVWPARPGLTATVGRAVLLALLGSCLLTVSAKVSVPGPVPMTLQSLAVMVLGAVLGARLAILSVALYLLEGAAGLSVFAGTPPTPSGFGYLLGPTGGFLLGFFLSAGVIGIAADRGWIKRPLAFAAALAAGHVLLLASGCAWLAVGLATPSGQGLGFARAFAVGVQPFLLGDAVKLCLAAIAFPVVFDTVAKLVRR